MEKIFKGNILEFMLTVGRLKSIKRTGWVRSGVPNPEHVADHMYMMAVMAFFIKDDHKLCRERYDGFYSRKLREVPHIAKMLLPAESLRMILVEDNRPEIDLSHKYFQSQITRLLNKGLKTIVVRIAANESPLPAQTIQSTNSMNSKSQHLTGQSRSRRCLDVSQNVSQGNIDKPRDLNILCVNDNSYNLGCSTTVNSSPELEAKSHQRPVLPLERHVKSCIKLALVHDMAECIVGDITPYCGVPKEEKHAKEKAAMEHLSSLAGAEVGPELFALWQEYETQASPEACFVKNLDRFDMILQAHQYEQINGNFGHLEEFFNSTKETTHILIKAMESETTVKA